jgi:hypothetical protein
VRQDLKVRDDGILINLLCSRMSRNNIFINYEVLNWFESIQDRGNLAL